MARRTIDNAGLYDPVGPSGYYYKQKSTAYGTGTEKLKYEPILLYPSQFNNPVLALPQNFGGQDGDRSYPIHYTYDRKNAGVGKMYDTRDFVNHNLDSRSNDYNYRSNPDPSLIQGFKCAAGFTPPNPNGTINVYNPPHALHGLPPMIDSKNYFVQQVPYLL